LNEREELINELERMDDTSINIIIALHVHGKLRFNQLYRILREYGIKKSRPTIVEHLRRLVKKKWIIRKREGKQFVTYQLTEDKAKALEVSPEELEEMLEKLKMPELVEIKFEVLFPPSETVKQLMQVFLQELKAELAFKLEYPKTSETSNYIWFRKSIQKMLKDKIMQKCLDNIKFRKDFVKALSDFEKKLFGGEFYGSE